MSDRKGSGGVTATLWTVVRPAVRNRPGVLPGCPRRGWDDHGVREGPPPLLARRAPGRRAPDRSPWTIPVPRSPRDTGGDPRHEVGEDAVDDGRALARSSVAAWWTVALSNSSSRTPGLGGSTGGLDRTTWTARPASRRPPRSAGHGPTSAAGGHQRVGSSASAALTRNSRLRSLLPPNADGRGPRVVQTSARRRAPREARQGVSGETVEQAEAEPLRSGPR
jgi:hypothetical protein